MPHTSTRRPQRRESFKDPFLESNRPPRPIQTESRFKRQAQQRGTGSQPPQQQRQAAAQPPPPPQRTGGAGGTGGQGPQLGADQFAGDPIVADAQRRRDEALQKKLAEETKQKQFGPSPQKTAALRKVQEAFDLAENFLKVVQRQAIERPALRSQFANQLNIGISRGIGQARSRSEQALAQRGLSDSDKFIEGQNTAIEAAGTAASVGSIAAFDGALLQAQLQERDGFERAEFNFIINLATLLRQQDFQLELAEFQANLERDLASLGFWGDALNAFGKIAPFVFDFVTQDDDPADSVSDGSGGFQ